MGVITLAANASDFSVTLSVVVPYYNEVEVLPEFYRRLTEVLEALPEPCEIVFVNDGSTDGSFSLVESFQPKTSQIISLNLSRNFGKEAAMSAGLEHSNGQAVIILDADLQDPPELIPAMLAKWREGYHVVNMQRSERQGESWLKRKSASAFYRLLNGMVRSKIPENVGDFRLLTREVVNHINHLPERNRYMKGIFAWPGFTQTTLQFVRDPRFCGTTKWNYFKLLGLAMDGIASFSMKPLRMATLFGIVIATSAFIYGLIIISKTLVFGEAVTGYPSMMVVLLALGGIQLLSVGLLGEYIGRIFIETKQRPLYLLQSAKKKLPSSEKHQQGKRA